MRLESGNRHVHVRSYVARSFSLIQQAESLLKLLKGIRAQL
ncbi:hypothetical protein [Sphingomonas piscis]|nr:hypothetical protein [Sphingomonas piscis]